ncbi:MAG: efflux RND transporter periplasmic adaptor subunit [Acidobacteria bacterium]|nr:efflux RND transporter periplasmic adaptor subunit [Acidobacteriota bacterium]
MRIDRDALEVRRVGGGWIRYAVALAVVIALALAAVVSYRRFVEPLSMPEVEIVRAEVLAPAAANSLLTASGYVVAQRKAAVTTKIAGRLVELKVREGSRVKAGEMIARIENRDYEAQLDQSKRQLEVARAARAEAVAREYASRRELERQTRLLAERVASQSGFDAAEAAQKIALAQIDSASAEISRAEGAVTVAEVNLRNTFIIAPFDGVVTTKSADIGEIIAPVSVGGPASGNSLVQIADMSSLEAEVDINESHISRLHEGQPATIVLDAYPETSYPGRLRQIVPTANRQKATIQGKVAFDRKGDEVLPEMSVRVNFLEDRAGGAAGAGKARVFAPASAITTRDGAPAAVVVRDGRASVVAVKLGPEVDGRLEITSGLAGGESLVVNPTDQIREGTRVRLRSKS